MLVIPNEKRSTGLTKIKISTMNTSKLINSILVVTGIPVTKTAADVTVDMLIAPA